MSIAQDLVRASSLDQGEVEVTGFTFGHPASNELLFFFKPETFMLGDDDLTQKLIELVLEKFRKFGVEISGALMFSGERLSALGIMDRHYGYINRLSRNASRIVESDDLERAATGLSLASLGGFHVLGGHEALARFPEFDANSLNELWATKKSVRLRGGFYVQTYTIDGKDLLLVNGFHPAQLEHFTAAGRRTAVLLLHSDSPWRALRWDLVGDGFPERANAESIRGEIYRRKHEFGLETVTIANNFVHLSAGPFEALFEINNFLGTTGVTTFSLDQCNIARQMREAGLASDEAERALANPRVDVEGKEVDLFSRTEDIDTQDAIALFGKSFSSVPRPGEA